MPYGASLYSERLLTYSFHQTRPHGLETAILRAIDANMPWYSRAVPLPRRCRVTLRQDPGTGFVLLLVLTSGS